MLVEGGLLVLGGWQLAPPWQRTSVTDFAWDDQRQVGVATTWRRSTRAASGLSYSAWRIAPEFVDAAGAALSDHDAVHINFEWTTR